MAISRHWATDAATSAVRSKADVGDLSFGIPALHVCSPLGSGRRAITPPMSGSDPDCVKTASERTWCDFP